MRKHGVGFDEAASAFFDAAHLVLEDPKYDGRLWLIGFSHGARLLLVVHVALGVRVRIISARKAERHEAKLYREG